LWWEKTARPQLPLWWDKLGKWQLIATVVTLSVYFIALSLTDNWDDAIAITVAIAFLALYPCCFFLALKMCRLALKNRLVEEVTSGFLSAFAAAFYSVMVFSFIYFIIVSHMDVPVVVVFVFGIFFVCLFLGIDDELGINKETGYGIILREVNKNLLRLSYTVMFILIAIPMLVSLFLR